MAVEIKELIIKGHVKGSSSVNEHNIIKIIEDKLQNTKNKTRLSESVKRQLVDECVAEVLKELEFKLNY